MFTFIRVCSVVATVGLTTLACSSSSEDARPTPKSESNATASAIRACRSVADAEGRCLSATIPQVAAQKNVLPKATCNSDELCAPCFDPSTGASTGACNLGDDTPKEPAKRLATCCGGRATCVPSAAVDASFHENLEECPGDALLCVPNELVADRNFKGGACKGYVSLGSSKIPYDGVCLSDCLGIEQKDLLSRDGCASGSVCVPCNRPDTGDATGAPGCPPK